MNRKLNDVANELNIGQDSDPGHHEKLNVAVDLLVFTMGERAQDNARKLPEKELRVLLQKRRNNPERGKWALPGGFVAPSESLEQVARAIILEKTGVADLYLEQLYTYGEVKRDPRTRVISCSYLALVDSTRIELSSRENIVDIGWFKGVSALMSEQKTYNSDGYINRKQYALILEGDEQLKAQIQLNDFCSGNIITRSVDLVYSEGMFLDHAAIIWTGIERLRNKLEYTALAFSLIPELFTLTELQQVYETILGRELMAANFRRKICHLVEETDRTCADYQHRPARLFRFKPVGGRDKDKLV